MFVVVSGDEVIVYDVRLKKTEDASAVIILSSSSATELKVIICRIHNIAKK